MDKPDFFSGPVPGESLTAEPGNYPWEQPPLHADPMDAFEWHLEQLTDEAVTDNVLAMLDLGVPVSVMTDTMLSRAIMDGIHSVDVKMLLKPVLTKQVEALAEVAGIDYKLTMDDYLDKDEAARLNTQKRIAAKLKTQKDLMGKKADAGDELEADVAEMLIDEPEQEAPMQETPTEGIMSKEQM